MGKIVCCSLSQLKNVQSSNSINLLIVRNPKGEIKDVTVFQYLAPSKELYTFAMENKDNPGWWDIYKSVFLEELESVDKKLGLGIVQDYVEAGFQVNLICYCGSYENCHRSLVAEKLRQMGLEVELM